MLLVLAVLALLILDHELVLILSRVLVLGQVLVEVLGFMIVLVPVLVIDLVTALLVTLALVYFIDRARQGCYGLSARHGVHLGDPIRARIDAFVVGRLCSSWCLTLLVKAMQVLVLDLECILSAHLAAELSARYDAGLGARDSVRHRALLVARHVTILCDVHSTCSGSTLCHGARPVARHGCARHGRGLGAHLGCSIGHLAWPLLL